MLFTKSFSCNLDWGSLVGAFYRMYPSKYYPHVHEVYTINHQVLPELRQLKVQRIARVKYDLPPIVHYIVGPSIEYMILEDSCVDIDKKQISHKTIGLTMRNTYSYEETATFEIVDEGLCNYNCSTDFRITGFSFLNSTLETVAKHVVAEFSKNEAVKNALLQAASNNDG